MLSLEQFTEMCKPPAEGKAFYRPLICNGDLDKVSVFFVGTNPATPIFPHQMDLRSYAKMLFNYGEFISFYKRSRLEIGKDEVSRTRIGMNSFLTWLTSQTDVAIAETEVIPYPTEKLKQLKKEPSFVIERGKEIFCQLVLVFRPRLLILHGKKTVDHVIDAFQRNGLIEPGAVNLEESIEQMESRSPLLEFTYPNGQIGVLLACRHFMYYGTSGDSFRGFRDNVLKELKAN